MPYSLSQYTLRLILLILTVCFTKAEASAYISLEEDTVKPIFVVPPLAFDVNCTDDNIAGSLLTWYATNGGALATDNSGVVTIQKLATLQEVQDSLANSPINCFEYAMGIYAIDTCKNSTDTLFTTFTVFDNQTPTILLQAGTINANCTVNVEAQLHGWFDNHGGSRATDNCADTVVWTKYIWVDNNNSVGEGIPGEGPYAVVDTSVCDWNVTVTFIVEDGCGNASQTTARFFVNDDDSPEFVNPPEDITISCITELPSDAIMVDDNCDNNVQIELTQTDNQSQDSLSCDYFNFTLTRTWSISDVCNNQAIHTQRISVIDTLVPEFSAPADITVFCGEEQDTSVTGVPIDISNNCNERAIISFSDSPMRDSCSYVINRFWEVRDVCGSSNTFPQVITVIDTTAPEIVTPAQDELIDCVVDADLVALFNTWINGGGSASVQDQCDNISFFAAIPGSYFLDTPITFPGTPPQFMDTLICDPQNPGVLNEIAVDFVFYDSCGNANVSKASFKIIDQDGPTFNNTINDIETTADADNCGAMVSLALGDFNDNCTTQEDISASVSINGVQIFSSQSSFTLDTLLGVGTHTVQYILSDCSGNENIESQQILIRDTIELTSTCPADLTVHLGESSCLAGIDLPVDYTLIDNCLAGTFISETQPASGSEFLTYAFNSSFNEFGAEIKNFSFPNFSANAITSDPTITVILWADVDEAGEFFNIVGEDGSIIGTVGERVGDSCNKEIQVQFTIDINTFNSWVSDGQLLISAIPNTASSSAELINPCDVSMVSEDGDNDGVSRMTITISYESLNASYFVNGATSIARKPFTFPDFVPRDSFTVGTSTVNYVFQDGSGSIDTCSFDVTVIDTIKPSLTCKIDTLRVHPSGLVALFLADENVIEEVSDNCSVSEISIIPSSFACSDVGNTFDIEVFARDDSGNLTSCTTQITIEKVGFSPSFEAGFCVGDSLKLFANLPDGPLGANYNFEWTGPNGFTSSDENPELAESSSASNGTYTITVRGAMGCVSTESVEVFIDGLATPEISTDIMQACGGESITLTTDIESTDVTYDWYSTLTDTTMLLASTDTSSFVVTPSNANNGFFVIISNQECASDPSTVINIEVIDSLVVSLVSSEIVACSGTSVTFEVENPDNTVDYLWTGPSGFSSNTPSPTFNSIATTNAGIYKLVAQKGACISDTLTLALQVSRTYDQPVIRGQQVYCNDATLNLVADTLLAAEMYSWFLNDSLVQVTNTDNLIIDNIDSTYSGNWSVWASNEQCASDTSANFAINVQTSFEINATSNSPLCIGDTLRLSVDEFQDATYSWQGPNGFTTIDPDPILIGINGDYRVTVINSDGCGASEILAVTVNSLPEVTDFVVEAPGCGNDLTDLKISPVFADTTINSFSWMGPNAYTSSDTAVIIPNATPNENGRYSLIIGSDICTSDTAFVDINITGSPLAPVITGDLILCAQDTFRLSVDVLSQQFDSLVWTTPDGSFSTIGSSFRITRVDAADGGEYSVILYTNGCSSPASNVIDLQVVDDPQAPPISVLNGPICIGNTLQLSAEEIAGAEYEWQGPNGFTAFVREPIIPNASSINQGNYSVRIKINDCESPFSQGLFVQILNLPQTPQAFATINDICADQQGSATICITSPTVTPGAVYNWSNLTTGQVLGESASSCLIISDLSILSDGANDIRVTATVGTCVSIPSEVLSLNIQRIPDGLSASAGSDILVCDNSPVDLSANMPTGTSGFWTSIINNVNFENSNSNTTTVSNLPLGESVLVWNLRFGNCNVFSTDTVSVFVEDQAILADDFTGGEYNQNLVFNVFGNDVLPQDYSVSIIDSPQGADVSIDEEGNIDFSPGSSLLGSVEVVYEVCNFECNSLCDRATLTILIDGDLECLTSSLITPNGDNINDAFVVPCLATGEFPNNELIIFNEWGDEVYSANPYNNDWEGTHNGKLLPPGTYFYILDLGNGDRPFRGFLLIEL